MEAQILTTCTSAEISPSLYSHQKEAVEEASKYDSFALFCETGTGKTPIALELIKKRKVPTLIICPLSIIESVWMEEIAKWFPDAYAVNLWKMRKKLRLEGDWVSWIRSLGNMDYHIGVINYESAKKLPEYYLSRVRFLILDESQKIKAVSSNITKFLVGPLTGRTPSLTDSIPYRLIMTGTPAPNTPMEYWPQMAVVNKLLLGPHFYTFRATHFRSFGYGGFQWFPRSGAKEWIIDQIKKQSYYISKEDCLDLPDQLFEKKFFQMEPQQKKLYDAMLRDNIVALRGLSVLSPTELVKLMKLRQITSGFIHDSTGGVMVISNAKFKLLEETIEQIASSQQVIIWCQFHYEIENIMDLLPPSSAVSLYGEMSQSQKEESIRRFTNGSVRFLVAHPKTGGVGLNFTNCSYNIYFSLDYSYESYKQSQDRTHRIGQTRKVTYFFLLAEGSIDEVIYKAVGKKENISTAMLEMLNA